MKLRSPFSASSTIPSLKSDPSLVNHLKWPNKPCEILEPSSLARDKILSNKAPVVVIVSDNTESVSVI